MYTPAAFLAPTSRYETGPAEPAGPADAGLYKPGGRGRIARWRITAVMFSRVASASRRSAEPTAVHSSSYRAFRRRLCSSRSLRFCSVDIVKTVDMEFSFVVLAAPTIGAACGPEVTISSRRPPHGRRPRIKDEKGEYRPRSLPIAALRDRQRSARKIPEGSDERRVQRPAQPGARVCATLNRNISAQKIRQRCDATREAFNHLNIVGEAAHIHCAQRAALKADRRLSPHALNGRLVRCSFSNL